MCARASGIVWSELCVFCGRRVCVLSEWEGVELELGVEACEGGRAGVFGSVRGGSMWVRGNCGAPAAVPSPYPGLRPALRRRPETGLRPSPGQSWRQYITSFPGGWVERVDDLEALRQDGVTGPALWRAPCPGRRTLGRLIGQRVCLFLVSLPRPRLPFPMARPLLHSAFYRSSFFAPFHLRHQSAALRGAWELRRCLEQPFFNLERFSPLFIHW